MRRGSTTVHIHTDHPPTVAALSAAAACNWTQQIRFTAPLSHQDELSAMGRAVDEFLGPRPWWFVSSEPYHHSMGGLPPAQMTPQPEPDDALWPPIAASSQELVLTRHPAKRERYLRWIAAPQWHRRACSHGGLLVYVTSPTSALSAAAASSALHLLPNATAY